MRHAFVNTIVDGAELRRSFQLKPPSAASIKDRTNSISGSPNSRSRRDIPMFLEQKLGFLFPGC